MNFIEEFKKGQKGDNQGLYMGDGLKNLGDAINDLQRGRMYGIASPPKTGKSTLVDNAFVIEPYVYATKRNLPVEWIYFSLEIDRVSKEFDFCCHFLYRDFGIEYVILEGNVTKKGKNIIPLSSDYLRGRLKDDAGKVIKVKPSIFDAMKTVYKTRIIPMFGEYSKQGIQIKKVLSHI